MRKSSKRRFDYKSFKQTCIIPKITAIFNNKLYYILYKIYKNNICIKIIFVYVIWRQDIWNKLDVELSLEGKIDTLVPNVKVNVNAKVELEVDTLVPNVKVEICEEAEDL